MTLLITELEGNAELAKTHHRKIHPFKPGWARELQVWPYLLRIEFLAAVIVTLVLLVWSITLNAPLEEPAVFDERGQGPRRRADADQPFRELAGETGQHVGPGRVGDSLDPDAFLALLDGGQKAPELGRRKKEIQAHPNILDHRMFAVYPVGVPLR